MLLLDSTVSPFLSGWWWLIPIICMVICMFACRKSGGCMAARNMRCRRNRDRDEINELRKEVQDLKERTSPAK